MAWYDRYYSNNSNSNNGSGNAGSSKWYDRYYTQDQINNGYKPIATTPPAPVAPVTPVTPVQPIETNPLQAIQTFISNLISGKKPEPTPQIQTPNNIDPTRIPQELKTDQVKESGASEKKAPNFIGQLVDAYKNYTQGQLKKEQENKMIKLAEEVQGKRDPNKISSLNKDLEEINLAMRNPSLGKKYLVSSKQKFMTDLGSVGAGASTLISSIADFYNRIYEQDAETMSKMASFKENPKVLNWLYKQEAEKSAAKSDISKDVSRDVRKWAEEVSPANPDFMDGLKNGVGSMGAFIVASVATGGGAPTMAVLEAMSESGTVYRENREKDKSIAESSELADKDFLANLVINYFTNKVGIFTDKQAGIRKTIMAGSSEGTQEALQQIASNLSTGKDMMEGVPESLGIGAILGTVVSPLDLGGKPTEITGENTQEKPVQKPMQTPSTSNTTVPNKDGGIENESTNVAQPIDDRRIIPTKKTFEAPTPELKAKLLDPEVEIYHGAPVPITQIAKEGFRFYNIPTIGEVMQFSDDRLYDLNNYAMGQEDNMVAARAGDFKWKIFDSVAEERAFVEKMGADNLADAINKEGVYDGFIVPQDYGDGHVYALANKEKVSQVLSSKKSSTQSTTEPSIFSTSDKDVNLNSIPKKNIIKDEKQPTDPLIQEARKYKSAEEFVKAQGTPVYRGGEKFTGDVGERGLPLTTDKNIAETFAREKIAFRKNPAGQIMGLKPEDIVLEEYMISPAAKIATKKNIPNNVFEAYKKANPVTQPEIAEPIISKWARDNGFDAVDFSTLGKTSAKEAEIKILNKDVIKTKSQLTDIWNKANKPNIKAQKEEPSFDSKSRARDQKELTAKTPSELKEMLDNLNKYGQTHAILRKIGGITNKKAAGQFVPPSSSKSRRDVAKEGEVRLKGKYVAGDPEYITVMAHELGHATELHVTGEINKKTLEVFGKDLSKETTDTILQELKDVTEKLEGAEVVASNPSYYNMKTELLARFFEMYITNPELLKETAPTAFENLELQSIKTPMLREFLEITDEHMQKIDKPNRNIVSKFLSDLRETYQNVLNSKTLGNMVYYEETLHRAMVERAKVELPKFVNEKFKGVKDKPELLFRVAESIKVTRNGKPEFGTRNIVETNKESEKLSLLEVGYEKVDTVIRNGEKMDVLAKSRYTPQEAENMYNQLSEEGKQLIKDFTAQMSEAKDYFNREIIKDVNKIESNLEGWVHHYFEDGRKGIGVGKGLGLKNKKAGASKRRTGTEGYVEDLQKAVTKALVDFEIAKSFNVMLDKQFARISKPLRDGERPDDGWVEVVGNVRSGVGLSLDKRKTIIQDGKSFVMKQPRYQIPQAIYERYNEYRGLAKEASDMAKALQRLNSYWAINTLTSPATASNNFVGGGIQYSMKVLTDFYAELLRGDVKVPQTKSNISAMLKVLLPKGWTNAPDYFYGADLSNWYGMFKNEKVAPIDKAIDKYADTNLKLFGAYERYWKKVIMTSENVSNLKDLQKVGKEGLRLPTDAERKLIEKIEKETDLYALNYNNVPVWLANMKKNPVAIGFKPFATYPYKYAKMISGMTSDVFNKSLPWQDRLAKLLALTTVMGLYAALSLDRKEKQKTPSATSPEIEIRAKSGGYLFTGLTDKDGKELFVRVAKYPFIGLTEAAIQTMKGNTDEAGNILKEMVGSIGFFGKSVANLFGLRDEYEKYDSLEVIMGKNLSGLVPYTRILDEISRALDPYQRKQTTFGQTFTKLIPTTSEDLQEKLHGDKRTVSIPIEGSVKRTPGTPYTRTTIDKTLQNYWQDILLSSLSGIYVKRVKPEDVEAQLIRDEKNKKKKEKEANK